MLAIFYMSILVKANILAYFLFFYKINNIKRVCPFNMILRGQVVSIYRKIYIFSHACESFPINMAYYLL